MPVLGLHSTATPKNHKNNPGRALRRLRFSTSTALAAISASMLVPSPAQAADECGALPGTGIFTCDPANNDFPDGIIYIVGDDPITLILGTDIIVDTGIDDNQPGVSVSRLTADIAVQHDGSITTGGAYSEGIRATTTGGGDISITG